MTIKITEELNSPQVAMELLRKDCLSCRKCVIGGKCPNGTSWDIESGNAHISNVFSTMNLGAQVMVVGQNPGAEEVERGIPFVGPSGKVFDEVMLRLAGLRREDFYITNTIKCLTPKNRHPTQGEIDNCRDFLDLELKLVKPSIVVALGSCAFKVLTGMSGIMKHCSSVEMSPRYMIPVVAMLHPSPYNTNHPERRQMFEEGVKVLAKELEK